MVGEPLQLMRHTLDAEAAVRSLRVGIRLSGRISTRPECLWTSLPDLDSVESVTYGHGLTPELTHKHPGLPDGEEAYATPCLC